MLSTSPSAVRAKRHVRLARAAVLDDVVQPFLDDAEQAELHIVRQRSRHILIVKTRVDTLREELLAVPTESLHEAEHLQLRRVQPVGEVVDLG